MTRSISEFSQALNTFVPEEDNDAANLHRLYLILEDFQELSEREKAMPAMFDLLERYPDTELGSPGPLVHALETIPGYEILLEQSLARQSTALTVWMVNRILNSAKDETRFRQRLPRLHAALEHPLAPELVRETAANFINRQ